MIDVGIGAGEMGGEEAAAEIGKVVPWPEQPEVPAEQLVRTEAPPAAKGLVTSARRLNGLVLVAVDVDEGEKIGTVSYEAAVAEDDLEGLSWHEQQSVLAAAVRVVRVREMRRRAFSPGALVGGTLDV